MIVNVIFVWIFFPLEKKCIVTFIFIAICVAKLCVLVIDDNFVSISSVRLLLLS